MKGQNNHADRSAAFFEAGTTETPYTFANSDQFRGRLAALWLPRGTKRNWRFLIAQLLCAVIGPFASKTYCRL